MVCTYDMCNRELMENTFHLIRNISNVTESHTHKHTCILSIYIFSVRSHFIAFSWVNELINENEKHESSHCINHIWRCVNEGRSKKEKFILFEWQHIRTNFYLFADILFIYTFECHDIRYNQI